MLDRLIETTDNGRQARRMRKFLMGIGTLMSIFFVCGLIFSIFSTNLAMGSENIELTSLMAPANIPEQAPPPPAAQSEPEQSHSASAPALPKRVVNQQRTDESPVKVPAKVSTTANKYKARPNTSFKLSNDGDQDGSGPVPATPRKQIGAPAGGFGEKVEPEVKDTAAPVIPKQQVAPPPKVEKKPDVIRSLGVVNGKAINLVKPVITNAIRMTGAKGQIRVNVLISETGKVISATAGGGNPLLKREAISAALRSSFSPTSVSNTPVKVRGVIIYNFN